MSNIYKFYHNKGKIEDIYTFVGNLLYDLNISSEVLSDFFQGRRSLTKIFLRRCSEVDDAVVRMIANHCPKLQSLNITREKDSARPCRVSDDAISYLAEKSPDLAFIYLKRRGVSDVAVNKLAEFCHMLKVIDLESAPKKKIPIIAQIILSKAIAGEKP